MVEVGAMGKWGWYALLAVVFGVIPGWIFYKTSAVMSAYSIPATEPFPAQNFPEHLSVLTSITGSGGKLFEFYDRNERTKFSLLVSRVDSATAQQIQAPEVTLKVLIERQHARFVDQPGLAPFTQRYLGSAFDPQRAYEVSRLESRTPAIKFLTNKGANHALAAWRTAVDQTGASVAVQEIALLAMKKNEPVSAANYDQFVSLLRPDWQPTGLAQPAIAQPAS